MFSTPRKLKLYLTIRYYVFNEYGVEMPQNIMRLHLQLKGMYRLNFNIQNNKITVKILDTINTML